MNFIGIDDAARSPVLGPMIIAGISVPKERLSELTAMGIKDSKLLTYNNIVLKATMLMKMFPYHVEEVSVSDINTYNINDLEAKADLACYLTLRKDTTDNIFIDNSDYSRERFLTRVRTLFPKEARQIDFSHWTIEHNADRLYPACAAASILAKYHHNESIWKMQKKYGDIGSGAPGDPVTLAFLRANKTNFPPIVRTKWSTVQRILHPIQPELIKSEGR